MDIIPNISYSYNRFGALAAVSQSGVTDRVFSDLKIASESLGALFEADGNLTQPLPATAKPIPTP